jgi:hypothetical protein
MNWLLDKAVKNPIAWLFFALLVIAEYGNYNLGKDLHRMCDLLGEHNVSFEHPVTPQEEIDTICLSHRADD